MFYDNSVSGSQTEDQDSMTAYLGGAFDRDIVPPQWLKEPEFPYDGRYSLDCTGDAPASIGASNEHLTTSLELPEGCETSAASNLGVFSESLSSGLPLYQGTEVQPEQLPVYPSQFDQARLHPFQNVTGNLGGYQPLYPTPCPTPSEISRMTTPSDSLAHSTPDAMVETPPPFPVPMVSYTTTEDMRQWNRAIMPQPLPADDPYYWYKTVGYEHQDGATGLQRAAPPYEYGTQVTIAAAPQRTGAVRRRQRQGTCRFVPVEFGSPAVDRRRNGLGRGAALGAESGPSTSAQQPSQSNQYGITPGCSTNHEPTWLYNASGGISENVAGAITYVNLGDAEAPQIRQGEAPQRLRGLSRDAKLKQDESSLIRELGELVSGHRRRNPTKVQVLDDTCKLLGLSYIPELDDASIKAEDPKGAAATPKEAKPDGKAERRKKVNKDGQKRVRATMAAYYHALAREFRMPGATHKELLTRAIEFLGEYLVEDEN